MIANTRYLPLRMQGGCGTPCAAVGWQFDEADLISDEAEYDYENGWVEYTYRQTNAAGDCAFVFRSHLAHAEGHWFDCEALLYTDGILILQADLHFPDTLWTDNDAWLTNEIVMDGDDVLAYLSFFGSTCLWANLPV